MPHQDKPVPEASTTTSETAPRIRPGDGSDQEKIIPDTGHESLPMVGIGGSAGAIPALQTFFESTPTDTGMVFVVVLHLSPSHTSILAEMIQRWTSMSVFPAQDGMVVSANCIYVIPPGQNLASSDGHLWLTPFDPKRGRHIVVDLFFRSLADSHGPNGTAIVLSGADGDGSIGIKRVKEYGGLTIAQDPEEAEQRGMPEAAINTGMVDWVLRVAEIPGRLVDYIQRRSQLHLPSEDGWSLA